MSASPPVLPLSFPLERLPHPAYMVGGAVRDWLLNRAAGSIFDLDLVLANGAVDCASTLAKQMNGGFVVLDDHRQIARVVLDLATIDIAQQAGPTLEDDLKLRDFTCNAVAFELHREQWIDPLNGRQDIQERRLRVVHPDNLTADPLRLLRGYRQAAQLGFELEEHTRQEAIARKHLLSQMAAERVRTELGYMLELNTTGLTWLQNAWRDGMLDYWLPELTEPAFTQAHRFARARAWLWDTYPPLYAQLQTPLCDRRSGFATVLLGVLLLHLQPEQLAAVLARLKYSRVEQQWIQRVVAFTPQLSELCESGAVSAAGIQTRGVVYDLYEGTKVCFPAVALAAIATGADPAAIAPLLERFSDPNDPLAHQVPLVNGRQLMDALAIKSGPYIGELLAVIKHAQAEQHITTAPEAITFAQEWLAQKLRDDC